MMTKNVRSEQRLKSQVTAEMLGGDGGILAGANSQFLSYPNEISITTVASMGFS
jgi:hypothetical protein